MDDSDKVAEANEFNLIQLTRRKNGDIEGRGDPCPTINIRAGQGVFLGSEHEVNIETAISEDSSGNDTVSV